MNALKGRLTYANVISTLCLFLLLGGGAYAAVMLPKNSVGTKQLKKNAVTGAKIKKEAVTAAKVKKGTLTGAQINASTLGTVPTAQTANALAPPEAWHEVGASGEPAFQHGWKDIPAGGEAVLPESVAFYKDGQGIVHLKGLAISGSPGTAIFQLPTGYRPKTGKVLAFTTPCTCGVSSSGTLEVIGTIPSLPTEDGVVGGPAGGTSVFLDGITFRAES